MLRIQLFGGFQAFRDGVPLRDFQAPKAQSLLAYLLIYRDRAHPRSLLAELFWEGQEESRARANLRNTLHLLRQVLEGPQGQLGLYLLSEGAALRFNLQSQYSLDIEEFEKNLDAAHRASGEERVRRLRQAVSLYQGDLLAGFYDDWIFIEQDQLKEKYVQALKDVTMHYREFREYPKAIEWAQRALSANPLQEDLHRQLIELYALAEDRAAALRQYKECAAILKRELAIEPLPETRALYESLQRGQGGVRTPAPLPVPTGSIFVGRESVCRALDALWQGARLGQGQAVLVGGEVGVGKTSLVYQFLRALEPQVITIRGAAHALGNELPYQPCLQAARDALRWISTEKLATLPAPWRSELALFLPELQEKLPELTPNAKLPAAQGKARWFSALTGFFALVARENPSVLFFDDLHWADDTTLEYLSYLIANSKTLRLLLIGTYRTEEALEGSRLRRWLDQLGPGRSYQSLTLLPLSLEETNQLLDQLLPRPDHRLGSALYEETGGNPLFCTELVRSLGQSGLLQRDEQGRWSLSAAEIHASDWPESLRELIHASLRRVPGRLRSLLGPAAVKGRAFELAVLQEILRQPDAKLLNQLDELCSLGLFVEREGRYQFHHEIIRQVLYEDLSADRRRRWHRQVAQAMEAVYPERLDEFSGELAWHFQQAQLWEKAIIYAVQAGARAQQTYAQDEAMKFFLAARGFFKHLEARQALNERWRRIKLELLEKYCNLFDNIYDLTGDRRDFHDVLTQMRALAQELGDHAQLSRAYQNQALLELAEGKREAARTFMQQAVEISQRAPDRAAAGLAFKNMADFHAQLNEYSPALAYYQRAAEVWQSLGDIFRQSSTLLDIAYIQLYIGQPALAQQNVDQAIALRQALPEQRGLVAALNMRAAIFQELGQWQESQACYERAYQLLQEASHTRNLGVVLLNLATLQNEQGRWHEALSYLDRVTELFGAVGTKGLEVGTFIEKGRAHWGLGELRLALEFSARGIKLLEAQQGIIFDAPTFYFYHSQILRANQQTEEAQAYLKKAYDGLQRAAKQIQDKALRQRFLENVRINRAIIQAWEALPC
jgi:predicted ATPase/DNA-binding SARP family transcriptional activator